MRAILPKWPPREYQALQPVSGRVVRTGSGEELVILCGTSYLALPWQPGFEDLARGELDSSTWFHELASVSSHYLGGTTPSRLTLERTVAQLCNRNAGVAFNNGWAACYGVARTLAGTFDTVISDHRSHNSTIEGLQASRQKVHVVDVTDSEELRRALDTGSGQACLFMPSISGMDGRIVSLPDMCVRDDRLFVVVDESHSTAMFGETGWQSQSRADLRVVSLSKAVGGCGAVVVGDEDVCERSCRTASSWMFSTPLPPLLWRLSTACVEFSTRLAPQRKRCFELAERFRRQCRTRGVVVTGDWHISGWEPPASRSTADIERLASERGYFIRVSEFPTVPRGRRIVRVSFTPDHLEQDADGFAEFVTSTA